MNNCLLRYNASSNKIFYYFQQTWLNLFSAVKVVPSNPCAEPSPRPKIYFFLLSTCTEEFISNSKIIWFLPNPLPTEKIPFLSNPIPYPEYLYSSISTFLVKRTGPNKKFSSVR